MASTAGIADTPQRVVLEQRTSPQALTQLITFDATVRIVHASQVEVTDHPIEDGSVVTDHSRRLPKQVTLDVVVSNDPIVIGIGEGERTRAQDAYAELERLQAEAQLLTVRLFLRDYDNMIIATMSAPRDAATGNVLSASLTLRELITATTERVAAPEPTQTVKSPRQNVGRRNTTESPPENQAKAAANVSALTAILRG